MHTLTRAYDARVDVQAGERTVVAVVNTAGLDRYRTVIMPGGIDLKAYRTNPVVMWEHGLRDRATPVGRNVWIKHDKASGALVAKTLFLEDEFSDSLFQLYQSSAMRAFSVNVLPLPGGVGPPTSQEIRDRPELAEAFLVYRKTELAEYSAVAVPGNSEALTLAVARGLFVPPTLRAALAPAQAPPALPPLDGARTLREACDDREAARRKARADRIRSAVRETFDLMEGRV